MPSATATKRESILDRAADLASTDGLEGLTIGRLADALGMSKSGVFAHFGSKQELQLATVEAAAQRFLEEVAVPAQEAPPGEARLRAYTELYLDHAERGTFPGGCFWAAATAEFDDRPGPVRDAVRASVQAWVGELAEQARLAGRPDPEQVAFDLYAVGLAANAYRRLLGDDSAYERARASAARRLDG